TSDIQKNIDFKLIHSRGSEQRTFEECHMPRKSEGKNPQRTNLREAAVEKQLSSQLYISNPKSTIPYCPGHGWNDYAPTSSILIHIFNHIEAYIFFQQSSHQRAIATLPSKY
uniref:Uncharacterized protein n=1 Tax=Parascaris univalens TaxID=6257 RepID=A0A915CCK9_PARUN